MNRRANLAIIVCAALAGCTISRSVQPIGNRALPATICIQHNDTVWSEDLLAWLVREFRRHGFETIVYQGALPEHCRLHARYWATWDWELAAYLKYAIIRVFDGDDLIGYAAYDATRALINPGKFGETEEKLRPLIEQLLRGALPTQTVPAPAAHEP